MKTKAYHAKLPLTTPVVKPALARMSPERLAQLGGDFALERCPARPGYERLLRRRCGAGPAGALLEKSC